MGKLIVNFVNGVNQFFEAIIDDEVGRFFCLHLPFWALVIYSLWHLTEYLGLFLIAAALIFVWTPYFIARVGHRLYEQSKEECNEAYDKSFWVGLGIHVVSILVSIGVPYWYEGFMMALARSQFFIKSYWFVVESWWEIFNFYHKYKIRDLNSFSDNFVFNFQKLQWAFFISAVLIVPGLFFWIDSKAKKQSKQDEAQYQRSMKEAEDRREKESQKEIESEARRKSYEERLRQENEAKKEEMIKLQVKINEVKGKDPWESGFL